MPEPTPKQHMHSSDPKQQCQKTEFHYELDHCLGPRLATG
jgi:hypothetical protein